MRATEPILPLLTPEHTTEVDSTKEFDTSNGVTTTSEQEWEAAARGGESHEYAGSDNLGAVGWYDDNSGGTTHPVCEKARNAYGLCDMSGNVSEWTSSVYSKGNADRFYRGGSWDNRPLYARVANRNYIDPDARAYDRGFRLARTSP